MWKVQRIVMLLAGMISVTACGIRLPNPGSKLEAPVHQLDVSEMARQMKGQHTVSMQASGSVNAYCGHGSDAGVMPNQDGPVNAWLPESVMAEHVQAFRHAPVLNMHTAIFAVAETVGLDGGGS